MKTNKRIDGWKIIDTCFIHFPCIPLIGGLLFLLIASVGCGKVQPMQTVESTCQSTFIEQAQGLTLWANDEGVFVQDGCTASNTVQNSCNQIYNGTLTCGVYNFTITNGVAK